MVARAEFEVSVVGFMLSSVTIGEDTFDNGEDVIGECWYPEDDMNRSAIERRGTEDITGEEGRRECWSWAISDCVFND
jgi:hypothetical protein